MNSLYSSAVRAAIKPRSNDSGSSTSRHTASLNKAKPSSNHGILQTIFTLIKESAEKDPNKPINWNKWQVCPDTSMERLIVLIV